MQDGDGPLRWDRRRPTVRGRSVPAGGRAGLAPGGTDGHHERVSRESLGDAPPDALADERARPGAAPAATALLETLVETELEPVTIAPRDGDGPPTRGLALRPPATDPDRPAGTGPDDGGPDAA